jgi:hypothetical protein
MLSSKVMFIVLYHTLEDKGEAKKEKSKEIGKIFIKCSYKPFLCSLLAVRSNRFATTAHGRIIL